VKWDKISKAASDTLALGLSSGVATCIQGVTTFGLSKLLSTTDFGAWREFVLCTTFVGILQGGFADGLQVAWCTGVPKRRAPGLRSGVRALLLVHLCWLAIAVALSVFAARIEPFRFFFVAVALFALAWNTSTAFQFHAQCRERFGRLSAFVTAYPAVVLVVVALLLALHAATPFHIALGSSIGVVVSSFLTLRKEQRDGGTDDADGAPLSVRETVVLGLPILALNNAMIGIVNFDKVAASILFPPKVFAIYAFASVLVVFLGSAITAGSRVVLPAFARRAAEGTLETAATTSTRASIFVWSLGLLGYFPAAAIVMRVLPRYDPALPLARWLFVATLFVALPQIVHMNACRALRVERTYLKWTGYLVALAFAGALLVGRSFGLESLAPFALAAAVTWSLVGAALLKAHGYKVYDAKEIVAAVWLAVGFLVATHFPIVGGAGLYVLFAGPLWAIAGLRLGRRAAV
jgi:O-antigen/teichoic acid export membrane protein